MDQEASVPSGATAIVEPSEIPAIIEERNRLMQHLTLAIANIERLDAQAALHIGDERWDAELKSHLRHVEHTQIALQHSDYMLELAQRARTDAAGAELSRTQTALSKSMNYATWVMAIAVVVQLALAYVAWRWPRSPEPRAGSSDALTTEPRPHQ
jgi:hypothetical protein